MGLVIWLQFTTDCIGWAFDAGMETLVFEFFRFFIFSVLVYKEDDTHILRPRKNILYNILHVTSLC